MNGCWICDFMKYKEIDGTTKHYCDKDKHIISDENMEDICEGFK